VRRKQGFACVLALLVAVKAGAEPATADAAAQGQTPVSAGTVGAEPAPTGVAPPVAPAPAAAPNGAGSARSDAEELRALRQDVEQLKQDLDEMRLSDAESQTLERKVEIYGFADMGLQRLWAGANSAVPATGSPRALTFVLGNVNLYFDATPVSGWRALTEIRITNYPDGALVTPAIPALGVGQQRTDTTIFDVNAPEPGWNEVRWGSLVLEQAWITGTLSDLFSVRLGYFLTPFGIWSIDHGSPTVIALSRPQFTRGRFFPDHQLGLQVLGQATKGAWTYGYVAYASNGKTQGTLDVNNDKAFGARLTAATTRPVRLTLGLSGYTGNYSEVQTVANADLSVHDEEVVGYRQWDAGADVSLDVGDFRLRTEGALERVEYRQGKRGTVLGIPGTQWPDRTNWAIYSIGAYRLPWWGLEPYVSGELFRYPTIVGEAAITPGIGLNIHFSTEVQLKTQFSRAHFFDFDGTSHSQQDASMLGSRLVIAF
jgi:hypothetical protein